jgi:hypothetical protein
MTSLSLPVLIHRSGPSYYHGMVQNYISLRWAFYVDFVITPLALLLIVLFFHPVSLQANTMFRCDGRRIQRSRSLVYAATALT